MKKVYQQINMEVISGLSDVITESNGNGDSVSGESAP